MSKRQPPAEMESPLDRSVYAADLAGDVLEDAVLTKLALDGLAASLKNNEPDEGEIEAVQRAASTTINCAKILATLLNDDLARQTEVKA